MIARLAPVAATVAAVSLGFPEQAESVPPPQHAAFSQHAAPCVDATCSPTRPSSTTQSSSEGPEAAGRSTAEHERERCVEVTQLTRAETPDRLAETVGAHSGRLLDEHVRR